MLKHTGPGKYYITTEQPHGVVRAWLYNFDVEGAFPKQQA
jgi:hypothetical protein